MASWLNQKNRWAIKVKVQLVGPDGCFFTHGVRVRCAPGNGKGSLNDEFKRNQVTPLSDEAVRSEIAGLSEGLREFTGSLPVVRLLPRRCLIAH